ncbi:MAG: tetratricopeptide repeat protein [Phycisphaerales bacterium]|jgi:tetratricopeptide (TPR) repeat protein|nr:tetratricopeptide repeat protein [Phycisphaerales bacterium]
MANASEPGRMARLLWAVGLAVGVGMGLAAAAVAQPGGEGAGGGPVQELSPTVAALLEAPYLTADEAAEMRVAHGVWTGADLAQPARRARAAVMAGAFADAALSGAEAGAMDRAEAALGRGDAAGALEMLGAEAGMRATRLRALAQEMAGDVPGAIAEARRAYDALASGKVEGASETASAVRAVNQLVRLAGTGGATGAGPQGEMEALIGILKRAREAEPLNPWVRVAEAELLLERDNFAQAQEAIREALALCPGCAEAWGMLGQMAVAAFDIPNARQIAGRVDAVAVLPTGDGAEAGGEEGERPEPPASVLGAAIRARAMLRMNDAEQAAEAIKPLVDGAFGRRRELVELRAAIEAVRYDFAAAERVIAEYETLSPGSPRAYLAAGKALAEARQYSQSAKWLEESARRSPHWASPVMELGLLEVQAGRDAQAIAALEKATALDPFNVRAANSLKVVREVAGYDRTEAGRFVIRSKPGIDTLLAREMAPVLEQIHAVVTGEQGGGLRHEPPEATTLHLMPDHRWFAVRIAGLPRIHTIAASTGPTIVMETPREGRGHTGTYDWERVVRHEYVHTVGLSRTGNRIPHWFTEAQAVYLELSPRDYSTIGLLTRALLNDELFDFEKINLAFTRPEKPTDRAQAYAQGHWMYEYLVRQHGYEAPLKLMDLYAKGVREAEAIQSVLGVSREQFFEAFKMWAHRQVRAWGMRPAEGQPTMAELIESLPPKAEGSEDRRAPTLEDADRWLSEHPGHPDVLELAMSLTLQAGGGEPTEAMRGRIEAYAQARPVDPAPVRLLARLALASADPLSAIPHLEYLDQREEKVATYAAQLAGLYARQGDWERAGQKAERATRIAPYQAAHRELAATVAIKRGDLNASKRHIEFLIALEPTREIHKQRLEAVKGLSARQAGN